MSRTPVPLVDSIVDRQERTPYYQIRQGLLMNRHKPCAARR
jgi:hypothetical protein